MTKPPTEPTAPPPSPFTDLIAALSEMENVGANRINPAFKARYVSLDALLDAVKPVLARHHLALVQVLESEDGKVGVSTSFVHASGHLFAFGKLLVKAEGLTAQQVGGSLTYIRRQSIQTACGISVDLDLDGNGLSASAPATAGTTFSAKPAIKGFIGQPENLTASLQLLQKKGWLKPGQGLGELTPDQQVAVQSPAFEQAVLNSQTK